MYMEALSQLMAGNIDFDSDNFKVALLTSSYTPNQDGNSNWSDISSNEISGTGYIAGGNTLANVTVITDNANNRVDVDADNVVIPNSTITARYAVIYKDTGNPATSTLIAYTDFGSDAISTNANFTIRINSAGFVRLSTT